MSNMYAVKHKESGLFFVGFDADKQPSWGSENDAKRMEEDAACQQALLFVRFGIKAQKKPVAL